MDSIGLPTGFFSLSLSLQVALGAGYLSYVTAYAGYRHLHDARDSIFIVIAFAALASLIFGSVAYRGALIAAPFTFAVTLLAGVAWRVIGRPSWHRLMRKAGIHRDDGVHSSWTALIQSGRQVAQVSIHTTDGRILYLSDRTKYVSAPWEGLNFGGDGSVVMIVEKEKADGGDSVESKGVLDDDWGTRFTYVPANAIKRVNIRLL